MNMPKRQLVTALLGALMFFHGPAFAAGAPSEEGVFWQTGANVFFKYEDQDSSDFGKNDHPVELDAEEMSAILGSLKIRKRDRRDPAEELRSLFSAEQADMLGRYLEKGLTHAKPGQDVVFAMERGVSRPLGLKPDRFFVAGRAFYKDNKLNVILGDYDRPRDEGYEAAYDPTHMGIVRYKFEHGSRKRSSTGFKSSVVEVPGVEAKRLNRARRDDWLVIDVSTALEAYDRKLNAHKKEEMARRREELGEILGSEHASRNDEADQPRDAARSVEERLTILNGLKAKGLVTDEEYAEKRKQILDDL